MGAANYDAWVAFNDGEKWLARFPKTGFSDAPPDLVEYLILSKFATLKFLESMGVPAPKAYGFGLASDVENCVSVNYLLMEALPAEPCNPGLATQSRSTISSDTGPTSCRPSANTPSKPPAPSFGKMARSS